MLIDWLGLDDILFGWFFDLLYIFQKSICSVIDFIVDMFYKLSGLETVVVDGKETDLLSHFLLSNGVKTAFLGVMLVGIILLFIFVIIAILRSEYAEGNQKKTKAQILTKAGQSFIIFIIIPFLLIAGVLLTNVIISSIHGSMLMSVSGGGKVSFGGQILVTAGHSSFKSSMFYSRSQIEQMFISGQLDYTNLDVVKKYYDLSQMNFLVGLGSSLVILVLFAIAAIRFVQRLFDVILLYIISPVSVSTIPADDGQRFKIWREMIVSKVLGAYGIILTMNLFFLIVPLTMRITFFGNSFQNGLVRLVFIIGGAFAVSKSNMVIAQLTGNNAGAQEAQQMLAGIQTGARMTKMAVSATANITGRIIGGNDFMKNKKQGASFGDNVQSSAKSKRNQHEVEGNKKTKHTAGQVASGATRLATMPVGVLKDFMDGGAITAGKNFMPRLKNIINGTTLTNRAEVSKKQEKSSETKTENKKNEKPAQPESPVSNAVNAERPSDWTTSSTAPNVTKGQSVENEMKNTVQQTAEKYTEQVTETFTEATTKGEKNETDS